MAWQQYWTPTCFVCGRDNPSGLRAAVVAEGGRAWVLAEVPVGFAGIPGMLHGGVVASLLDEAMWYAIFSIGPATVTGSLEVRFLRPVSPGVPVLAAASVAQPAGGDAAGRDEATHRWFSATARVVDEAGRLLAAGRGRFADMGPAQALHRFIRVEPAGPEAVARIRGWPGAGREGAAAPEDSG